MFDERRWTSGVENGAVVISTLKGAGCCGNDIVGVQARFLCLRLMSGRRVVSNEYVIVYETTKIEILHETMY